MNRVIRGTLVLAILVGTVVVTASADDPAVPEEWKSLDVAGLTNLAKQFVAKGASGVDDCKRLAAYVAQRYADASTAGQVDWDEWSGLAVALARYYPGETRTAMSQDIRQQWAPNDEAIGNLNSTRLASICKLLDRFGEVLPSRSICITWLAASDKYKSAPVADLGYVAHVMAPAGDAGKPGREHLAAHIKVTYLDNKAAARSVRPEYWREFARFVYRGNDLFSAEDRQLWAGKIRDAFTTELQTLAGMETYDWAYLLWTLRLLGDTEVGAVTAKAVAETTAWQSWGLWDLKWLATTLADSGDSAKAARLRLIEHISNKYLADKAATRSVRCWYWREFVSNLGKDLSAEDRQSWANKLRTAFTDSPETLAAMTPRQFGHLTEAVASLDPKQAAPTIQQWAMKAYESLLGTEQARASAGAYSLRHLGQLLQQTGLTGKGKAYPEFAAALAGLAKNGKLITEPEWLYKYYAVPLGTAETRQTVLAELADSEGNPRPIAAKILAWAYRGAGELKTWQTFLDGKIAAAAGGDTKARWMITRAHAESIIVPEGSPLCGKKWLDQALATATSAPCQLEALREIVNGYAAIGRHDSGLAVLDSISGQFAGTDAADDVQILRDSLVRQKANFLTAQARYKVEHQRRTVEAWRRELRRRLEVARQKGDQESILQLERLLQQ